ncbi:Uncharacterized conserved protein YlxW, UPF0749 family [Clostridium acidisoli DSM 12555]|uniref:Uncharacterized conserved protein YlxW, UPF0749 family n=1 Tax=Clostridium acidisoli DSM 12555 TaxID=1121291 RepID=A0A1W1X164_9CLOT|nr:DUF881 domain-containing protein [Clostridium acidisoli]SMC17706.1 Uncharacterized conserved protein YlxW, UPF0749 family [Clostridium acidisoli DSM 12555]
MKNNEATFFVFIACIILGILITSNLNFNRETKNVFLNSKQYQEQYNYKNNLTSEVDELKNKYMDLSDKFQQLKNNNDQKNETDVIQNELNNLKAVSGETDLLGPGIVITINDGTDKFEGKVVQSNADLQGLIHNYDISYIVNDLKSAGAEAISVNDQRIVNTSEIYCTGPFIRINGVTVASPFYIKAIGNKDKLKDYMMADTNYLYMLLNYRGIQGTVIKNDNIKIGAYNNSINHQYLNDKN